MRRINEFKSYRSAVGYDAETGQFTVTPLPGVFSEEETEGAEIVPFPEPADEPQRRRMAG
jgi:hypothetical protein